VALDTVAHHKRKRQEASHAAQAQVHDINIITVCDHSGALVSHTVDLLFYSKCVHVYLDVSKAFTFF
jgi:hypothetical protein